MRNLFKSVLLIIVFAAIFSSCQHEENEMVAENPQNLTKDSELTGYLQRLANNTADDNIIDSTGCFKIKFPYTVKITQSENGNAVNVFHEITNAETLSQTTAIISTFNNGEDTFELIFPVTVVYEDDTEVIVSSEEMFRGLINSCAVTNPETSPISCLSINYPITIFGYNSNFQLANTYEINNDTELLVLILGLGTDEYYAINYPITVTFADGSTQEIHNNIELLGAIQAAVNQCGTVVNPCDNPNVLTSGLIIYMPFANEARDLISSETAAHNDNYPPAFVADRDGNEHSAVSFSGNELDVLKITETEVNHLKQGDSLTVSLWFRLQIVDNIGPKKIFQKSNDCNCNTGFVLGYFNAPFFGQSDGGIIDTEWSNNTLLINDTANWHHFAITVTPTNNVKLYRDGVLKFSTVMSSLDIGQWFGNYVLGKGYKGYLDDLRVYRKTLTPDQVETLYNLEGDNNTCVN